MPDGDRGASTDESEELDLEDDDSSNHVDVAFLGGGVLTLGTMIALEAHGITAFHEALIFLWIGTSILAILRTTVTEIG